jgi:hypothetical protein
VLAGNDFASSKAAVSHLWKEYGICHHWHAEYRTCRYERSGFSGQHHCSVLNLKMSGDCQKAILPLIVGAQQFLKDKKKDRWFDSTRSTCCESGSLMMENAVATTTTTTTTTVTATSIITLQQTLLPSQLVLEASFG